MVSPERPSPWPRVSFDVFRHITTFVLANAAHDAYDTERALVTARLAQPPLEGRLYPGRDFNTEQTCFQSGSAHISQYARVPDLHLLEPVYLRQAHGTVKCLRRSRTTSLEIIYRGRLLAEVCRSWHDHAHSDLRLAFNQTRAQPRSLLLLDLDPKLRVLHINPCECFLKRLPPTVFAEATHISLSLPRLAFRHTSPQGIDGGVSSTVLFVERYLLPLGRAPNLTYIELRGATPAVDWQGTRQRPIELRRVRCALIMGCNILIRGDRLKHLVVVSLFNGSLKRPDLLAALAASPALEILEVRVGSMVFEEDDWPLPRVHLPRLRHLVLASSPPVIGSTMRCLKLEAEVAVHFEAPFGPWEPRMILPFIYYPDNTATVHSGLTEHRTVICGPPERLPPMTTLFGAPAHDSDAYSVVGLQVVLDCSRPGDQFIAAEMARVVLATSVSDAMRCMTGNASTPSVASATAAPCRSFGLRVFELDAQRTLATHKSRQSRPRLGGSFPHVTPVVRPFSEWNLLPREPTVVLAPGTYYPQTVAAWHFWLRDLHASTLVIPAPDASCVCGPSLRRESLTMLASYLAHGRSRKERSGQTYYFEPALRCIRVARECVEGDLDRVEAGVFWEKIRAMSDVCHQDNPRNGTDMLWDVIEA